MVILVCEMLSYAEIVSIATKFTIYDTQSHVLIYDLTYICT